MTANGGSFNAQVDATFADHVYQLWALDALASINPGEILQ